MFWLFAESFLLSFAAERVEAVLVSWIGCQFLYMHRMGSVAFVRPQNPKDVGMDSRFSVNEAAALALEDDERLLGFFAFPCRT